MLNVNIRYKGKELSTILPKCNDELRADLKKAGIDLPAEKLKLRSSAKDQYLVGLYTNNPLDDLIIDRLCNNDNLFELNNLCGILDNVADHDLIFKTILCSDARCINGIKKLFADHFMEFSDKLVLNTHLEEKPATFNVKKCVIEKAIAVTHKNFEHISRFPFMSLAFLERNKDFMYYDDEGNMYHCILLYDIDFGDGIVIESEGSTYTRYAQYIPQAKYIYEQFLDSHLNEIHLCCPIEIYQHINDHPKDNCILDNADMAGYADDINTFIRENDLPAEHKRGLMLWYPTEPLTAEPFGKLSRPEKILTLSDQPQGYENIGNWTSLRLHIKQRELLSYVSSVDGSPSSFVSSLLFRSVSDLHPDEMLPVVCGMQHQFRKALGKPFSHHCHVNIIPIVYPDSLRNSEMMKLNTISRGTLIIRVDDENDKLTINQHIANEKLMQTMSLAQKREHMQKEVLNGIGRNTYEVSYAGRVPWSGIDRYITDFSPYLDMALSGGISAEIFSIQDYFCINIMQRSPDSKYFDRMTDILRELSIPFIDLEPAHFEICSFQV